MTSYAALAQTCRIAMPALFRQLLDAGLADHGPDVKAWVADWKAHTLTARPVLSCVYDFEWISAGQAQESIDEWLNPGYQHGRRFLPFAQTGAGDLYCLTPLDGTDDAPAIAPDAGPIGPAGKVGVALIWHDDDTSKIPFASFDDFVFDALVRSATDVSHLVDEDFTQAEARQCVATNIQVLAPLLAPARQPALEDIRQAVLSGAEMAGDALISPQRAQAALAMLADASGADASGAAASGAPFPIVARWDCGEH